MLPISRIFDEGIDKILEPEMHEGSDVEAFDDVTEQGIIKLWESLKTAGMSSNVAWGTIMTGIAMDVAFPRTKKMPRALVTCVNLTAKHYRLSS